MVSACVTAVSSIPLADAQAAPIIRALGSGAHARDAGLARVSGVVGAPRIGEIWMDSRNAAVSARESVCPPGWVAVRVDC